MSGARSTPRQERSRAMVEAIEQAAELIVAEGGSFTTNRVAERAGVSIGSLYRYFDGKEVLFERVVERYVARLEHAVRTGVAGFRAAPGPRSARALVTGLAEVEEVVPGLGACLNRLRLEGVVVQGLDDFEARMEEHAVETLQQMGMAPHARSELAARMGFRALVGVITRTLAHQPRVMQRAEFRAMLVGMLQSLVATSALDDRPRDRP